MWWQIEFLVVSFAIYDLRTEGICGMSKCCRKCISETCYSCTHLENIRCLLRFEKVRAAKMAAHRRCVLRVESQVAVLQKEAQQYQLAIEVERKKLVASVAELKSFELAR